MSGLFFKNNFALFGNISMQPAPIVPVPKVLQVDVAGPKVLQPSIKDILQINAKNQFLPPIKLNIKMPPIIPILPAYSRHLQLANHSDQRLADKLAKPNPKLTPLEQLTGISTIRPEILLATNFKPLFVENAKYSLRFDERQTDTIVSGLTEFGEFIDAQIQLNHLKHESISKLISDLKTDEQFASQLAQKESDFKFHLNNLSQNANFLRDVISQIEQLKLVLNIKREQFPIDFQRIIYDHFSNARDELLAEFESQVNIENNFSYNSILTELGFNTNSVKNFSNTKIFLQTLYELNSLLKGYSNKLLGENPIQQEQDTNTTFINKHTVKNFNFQINSITTVTFDFLANLRQVDVLNTIDEIKGTFDSLFSGIHLVNDESKIALLFQYLIKEFSFSRALGDQQFKNFINTEFGYSIDNQFNNEQMFDVVIGYIGDKITDRVNVLSNNSLTNVAQQVNGDIGILPLEIDYISYDNSTYTPGSIYLVDSILDLKDQKFNTTNLDAYTKEIANHIDRITKLCRYLNLIPQAGIKTGFLARESLFNDSSKFFDDIIYYYLDRTTNSLKPNMLSDALAIFSKAQDDNYLKSLLFTYVFSRTFGAENATAVQVLDTLITEIARVIDDSLGHDFRSLNSIIQPKLIKGFEHSIAPSESVAQTLRSTNDFLNQFFENFRQIFITFKTFAFSKTNNENFTTYSHVQDMTLLYVIFEMLLSVINKYAKISYTGKFLSKSESSIGKQFYSLRVNSVNNSISIQLVRSKLQFERDAMIKLLFTILSSLQAINDSSTNVSRTLQDNSHIAGLNDILTIIGDKNLLPMVINEQQIHLIDSTISDFLSKMSNGSYKTGITSADQLSSLSNELDVEIELGNKKDDLLILDDALITKNVRNVLYSYFADDKFTSKSASNIKLLTVGIPSGFSTHLRQKVKVEDLNPQNYNSKQTDVIKINVYKIDVEHQDIIFRPRSFIFELNRYVSKNDQDYRQISVQSPLDVILNYAVPTRDYSYVDGRLQDRFSYLGDEDSSLMNSSEYDFLSNEQKQQLIQNHVQSYLFELYIRHLTGMQVSEYDFLVNKADILNSNSEQFITDQMISNRMIKDLESFDIKNITKASDLDTFFNTTTLSTTTQMNIVSSMQQINNFSLVRSQFSNNDNESRRIFTPKIFERIFNIPIDPNEFEIDVSETMKTVSGKEMFNKLLNQGKILGPPDPSTFYSQVSIPGNAYKFINRDKNESDLIFEKYFVSIETVLGTEV